MSVRLPLRTQHNLRDNALVHKRKDSTAADLAAATSAHLSRFYVVAYRNSLLAIADIACRICFLCFCGVHHCCHVGKHADMV